MMGPDVLTFKERLISAAFNVLHVMTVRAHPHRLDVNRSEIVSHTHLNQRLVFSVAHPTHRSTAPPCYNL